MKTEDNRIFTIPEHEADIMELLHYMHVLLEYKEENDYSADKSLSIVVQSLKSVMSKRSVPVESYNLNPEDFNNPVIAAKKLCQAIYNAEFIEQLSNTIVEFKNLDDKLESEEKEYLSSNLEKQIRTYANEMGLPDSLIAKVESGDSLRFLFAKYYIDVNLMTKKYFTAVNFMPLPAKFKEDLFKFFAPGFIPMIPRHMQEDINSIMNYYGLSYNPSVDTLDKEDKKDIQDKTVKVLSKFLKEYSQD